MNQKPISAEALQEIDEALRGDDPELGRAMLVTHWPQIYDEILRLNTGATLAMEILHGALVSDLKLQESIGLLRQKQRY